MKVFVWVLTFALASINSFAAEPKSSNDKAAFEKLKTLVGEWEGKVDDRENESPIKVAYRPSSNGSIVTETLLHSARIQFESRDSVRGEWESYLEGKSAGTHVFFLKRKT